MFDFNPSIQQQAIFNEVVNGSSNLIVQAYAGCGKTTTIASAVSLLTGTSILLAFGKKNADDLKDKINGNTNATAQTFHSVGYWANRKNNPRFKPSFKVNHNNKVLEIVSGYCPDDEKLIAPLVNAVSMAKKVGIGIKDIGNLEDRDCWLSMINHFGILDEVSCDEDTFIDTCISALKDNNRLTNKVDFDDQIYFPLLFNWPLPKYDYVFVDEAQDTNPTRRLMASRMMKSSSKIVFVGDKYQAIMGFTGADNDALDIVEKEFKAITLPLSLTFRCPKAVVVKAQEFVDGIEAYDTNIEGEVNTVDFSELNSKLNPGDVILSRFNRPLISLFFLLSSKGVKAKIEGKDQINGLMYLISQFGKGLSIDKALTELDHWADQRIATYRANNKHDNADRLQDRVDCITSIAEYCIANYMITQEMLRKQLESMFGDNVSRKDVVSLSSCHKSKGLEWDNVFILSLDSMQAKRATKDWEITQELHLKYVAVTRAKKVLNLVVNVPTKINTKPI
jgi:DNA helicase-2/ATP-dependent DNA helicase PcrA